MTNGIINYAGFQIVTDANLVVAGVPCLIHRPWCERLFTRPWRPLRSTRWFTPWIASTKIIRMGNMLVMHPVQWEIVKANIQQNDHAGLAELSTLVNAMPVNTEIHDAPAMVLPEPECRITDNCTQCGEEMQPMDAWTLCYDCTAGNFQCDNPIPEPECRITGLPFDIGVDSMIKPEVSESLWIPHV